MELLLGLGGPGKWGRGKSYAAISTKLIIELLLGFGGPGKCGRGGGESYAAISRIKAYRRLYGNVY